MAEAGRVMAKLVPLESEVQSHSNRWYLHRSLPYRTQDDRIAGVVITFVDITARKHAERTIEATPFPLPFIGHTWMSVHSALRGFHSDGRSFEALEWPLARTPATGEKSGLGIVPGLPEASHFPHEE